MHKYIMTAAIMLAATITCAADSNGYVLNGQVVDSDAEPVAGATLRWVDTDFFTASEADGSYRLPAVDSTRLLAVSATGYALDTVRVTMFCHPLTVTLTPVNELDEVTVSGNRRSSYKMRNSVGNVDLITSGELRRDACCNLGESFNTNASVDVRTTDAATGAKQIRLLGLDGTYVQMMTDNVPSGRGSATPYALGYTPGPWLSTISVSKGLASVKYGSESMTGQINAALKDPADAEEFNINIFGNTQARFEANADGNIHLPRQWRAGLLLHYEDRYKSHDANHDGFIDMPRIRQLHAATRWNHDGGVWRLRSGLSFLDETRRSGQAHADHLADPYRIRIDTRHYDLWAKNAVTLRSDLDETAALVTSLTIHNQDGTYGLRRYDVEQANVYVSAIYEVKPSEGHELSAGASFTHDRYDEHLRLDADATLPLTRMLFNESTAGAYGQYTWNPADGRWTLLGGVRADWSSVWRWAVTPRVQVKWMPWDLLTLRASAGRGVRTANALAENNALLASGRSFVFEAQHCRESAWNMGLSASLLDLIVAGKPLTINAEYYYTRFTSQMVVDFDRDAHTLVFAPLDGRSYSHTAQLEVTWQPFNGFTATGAFRWLDVRTDYSGILQFKPLTNRFKGLLTAGYVTPDNKWQFDATLQVNGHGRMPVADAVPAWPSKFPTYALLSAQVTRYFNRWSVYVGCENITNYRQRDPIIEAANPWSPNFDATMTWGPLDGATGYIGLRLNLGK